jgi:DNA-binding protein H-NS
MNDTIQALLKRRDELHQELAALEEQIKAQQALAKKASIDRLKTLMAEEGLTLADLAGEAKASRASSKSSPIKGRKVPAKYRNSATGQEWSGRGIQPKWLQEAIAAGKPIEDFAIKS